LVRVRVEIWRPVWAKGKGYKGKDLKPNDLTSAYRQAGNYKTGILALAFTFTHEFLFS
jgi:hypothetical protein